MGQAKRRGTYEQRVAMAVEREKLIRESRLVSQRAREEQQKEQKKMIAIVGHSRLVAMATLGLLLSHPHLNPRIK